MNGKLALQNASINLASIPNGISNANGIILLNGTSAVIQNLTAQSGGGKLSANGFAALTGRTVQYGLRAKADHVRTRYNGASLVDSASISLSGNSEHSLLSGDVTVERLRSTRKAISVRCSREPAPHRKLLPHPPECWQACGWICASGRRRTFSFKRRWRRVCKERRIFGCVEPRPVRE